MTGISSNIVLGLIPIVFLGIIASSIILWLDKKKQNPLNIGEKISSLSKWEIPWIDVFLFLFSAYLFVLLSNSTIGLFIEKPEGDSISNLTPKIAILSICALHIPLGINFFLFQNLFFKNRALILNEKQTDISLDIIKAGVCFIQLLPLIWILSILWNILLGFLQELSLIDQFPAQALVELLTKDIGLYYFALLAFCGIVIAPIIEEILFRGCIYRFLKGKTSLLKAQLLSATLFALLHANLHSFLPLVFIGFILARIYESSGNIKQSILFHGFFNATSFTFIALYKFADIPIPIFFP